jgi:hypothetical protein
VGALNGAPQEAFSGVRRWIFREIVSFSIFSSIGTAPQRFASATAHAEHVVTRFSATPRLADDIVEQPAYYTPTTWR